MTIETELPAVKVPALLLDLRKKLKALPDIDRGFSWQLRNWNGAEELNCYSTTANLFKWVLDNKNSLIDELEPDMSALTIKDDPGNEGDGEAERLREALERVCAAIEREPIAGGDLDYPHGHNDWLGWRKKIMRPAAAEARTALSQHRKGSEADGK